MRGDIVAKKAVLFIHGFSAKQEDNQIFVDFMNKQKRIDFHTFILPGHDKKRMGKATYQDWINASTKELEQLLKKYQSITIVGHSMGTILAIYLAAHYKEVEKLVLVSPAYDYGNPEQNAKDFKKLLHHEINTELGTGFEGILYKIFHVPFPRFLEYRKLAKRTKENIKNVKCPTLILHGTMDNLIPIHSSLYLYNTLPCEKHLTFIEEVRHQVFKSKKAIEVSEYIYDYIIGGIHFKIKKRDLL